MTTAIPPWPRAARGEQVAVARGAGELGGLGERGAGRPAPARAVVGVAEREQQLATLGAPSARTRGQGRLVVRCRLGVGQRRGRLAGGGELPRRQALAAGQRPGGAQVTDDLAGADLRRRRGDRRGRRRSAGAAARGGTPAARRRSSRRRARGRTRSARADRSRRRARPRSLRRAPRGPRRPAGRRRGPAWSRRTRGRRPRPASSARSVESSRRASRRAITSRTPAGGPSPSPPASCASRSSSSRKNGLPPLRAR